MKTVIPEAIPFKNGENWRQWLEKNHDKKQSVWVLYYKKVSGKPSITYNEAVDEALCFGWIDSKKVTIDDEKFIQFFCKRKPKGMWSLVNKEKIKQLTSSGKMHQSGLDCIEAAKKNGSWIILDVVETLTVPRDLNAEFRKYPGSKKYFSALSKSDRRSILAWLVLAKKDETRQKRITEIAALASEHLKPKQFR